MSVKIVANILIIATTGCIISTGLSAKFRPPKIYLETEYSIHSNDNLTIRCEASKPITWTYPNNSVNSESFSQFFIRYENLNNKENKYVALLDITNASFVDTGFYYCHEKGADLNSNRTTSKIYLFVKDDEHLSTIVDEIETVYSTAQYEEAILPCRPTSADINVKLYKSGDDNEILLGQKREDGSVVTFDPRYGFIFTKHAYEEISGVQHIIYVCDFFRNHLTQISTVIHVIQPKAPSIAVPHIEDLNKGHSVEGDTLTLKCTLISIAHFNVTWTYPNSEGLETGRIIESNVSSTGGTNTYFNTLTIKNVTKADQGLYTCSVMNYSNKNNNTIKITIYDTDDHFINLMEETNVYNITRKAGTDSVQWSIKVDAHPIKDKEAHWYDNNNELIASSDGTRYKIEFSHKEAVLKINKVKIEDFGCYTLVVKNGFETAKIQLFLTVTDRPTVHIKMNDFHLIGTKSIAKCTSAGYPPPKIFWSFKPCLNGSCPSKEILSGKLQRKGLQIISEISIKASEIGQLTCFANNTFGEDFDTVPFDITGLSAKFRPPKIYLETEYSIHSNDNLTIRCEASKPITWTYPNNSVNSESFSQFFIRYENLNNKENKYVALLDITNASFVDTGFYYCHEKGADLNSNRTTSKIYLFVKDDEHLSTIVDEIETVYSTAQYEEAILPCRPTSADINVKLYKSGDDNEGIYWEKILLGQKREDGRVVTFDPRYGFIFVKHVYEEVYGAQNTIYECNFFRNHLTQISTVIHVIQPKTPPIAVPHIEDLNKGHSVEGDTLTLKCTLISNVQFSMTWTYPNSEGLETGRIIESNVNSTGANTHFKTLTIKNVTKADQGLYTCSVKDYWKNKNNNTIKIKINDTDDHFINLMEENNVYNITQKAGTDSVQWSIKVDAHPIKDLEAHWYDNNNELTASSDGTRYKIEFSYTEAVLKINKVKIFRKKSN